MFSCRCQCFLSLYKLLILNFHQFKSQLKKIILEWMISLTTVWQNDNQKKSEIKVKSILNFKNKHFLQFSQI